MASHRVTFLDVFTATPLAGNGLAVVHGADEIPDETMHAFARETRLSETTFVQAPGQAGADYRNRIWMMSGEIGFAGHPSLGTAVAVALERGEEEAEYVQETRVGLQPVRVRREGHRADVSMLQEPAALGPELDLGEVLGMLGLEPGDADPALPPQEVSTGAHQAIVPVRARALARIRPDYERIDALLAPFDGVVLYAAACDPDGGTAAARGFTRTAEMGEDPATGSAAGPLLAYLKARTGLERIEITQGVEMGRPSLLWAELEGDRVRVGGEAVVVIDGFVHLP